MGAAHIRLSSTSNRIYENMDRDGLIASSRLEELVMLGLRTKAGVYNEVNL